MAQNAYAWLSELQPASSTDTDPFADIPLSESSNTPDHSSQQAVNDPFADIPVARQSAASPVTETENKYWGQMKAGAYELAKNYYGNEARSKVRAMKQIDQEQGQQGPGFVSRSGLLGGAIVPKERRTKDQLKQDIAGDLVKARSFGTAAGNIPQLPSVQKFMAGDSGQGWWEDFKENPVEIALGITARSAPASLVSMGAGVVGGLATASPVGAMVGAGSASGRMEYISSIMQGLDEQGIDWTDPDEFIKAVSNDELMEPIKEKALKRGVAIGAFDGAAAMVGGKVLAPKSMLAKSAGKSQLVNMPAQMAAQGTLGAGGEAGAQLWSEGEISDTRGVIAEAIGELTFAPVEAGATLLSVTRGSKGIAEDRLKATNELIDLLVKKRQKAYASGDRKHIEQVSNDLNQYLNVREDLQKQLSQSDTDSLLQSEQMLQQQIKGVQSRLFTEKDPAKRQQLTLQAQELDKRRVQVSDSLASQNRTRTEPIDISRAQALTDVKLDRELYKQELRKREEEEYQQQQQRLNPMAAANAAQVQAAQEGGDALQQQLAASGAYANARSLDEMADEAAAEERRVEQEAIDRFWQPVDERNRPTQVNQQQVESGLLLRDLQQEQTQDKAMLQAEQEIADWEAQQGITREKAIDQAAQNREQYQEQVGQHREQQEQEQASEIRKQQIHSRIDEAVSAGEITPQGEPLARAYADRGVMPPGLAETTLADQINRLEGHITQQGKMDQAQQNWTAQSQPAGTQPQPQPAEMTGLLKRELDLYRKSEKVDTSAEPVQKTAESIQVPEQTPKPETQVTENFEQQLREIGKEWIKDKQHRFYFNDIIKELSGMDVPVPANAKLWYDRNTEFYGQENIDNEVFDAAVERLEALRDSLLAESDKGAKPSESEAQTIGASEKPKQPVTKNNEPPTATEPEPTTTPEPIKQTQPTEYGQDFPSITHTTKRGKTIHGVVDTSLTKEQAKAIDPFSFKKDDGWFIRDFRIGEYNDKLMAGTMEPVHPVEETTDENAERPSDRALEREPAEQVSDVPGERDTGEGSSDYTVEGGGHGLRTDGRRIWTELRGGEEQSVLGTDLHSAGAVSDSETGSAGGSGTEGTVRLGKGREGGVNTGAADYTITEADNLEGESFKQVEKFNHNIEAIKLLKELGDRPATQEQQAILARYVGWGGIKQAFYREDGSVPKGWEKRAAELKALLTPEEYTAARSSILNAHYTTPTVVNSIYAGLEKLGFTHGRVLEPSVGVGNFFGMMPKSMRGQSNLVGVELDTITGGIAKKLYSGARIAAPMGFENFDIAENSFDLVIGNPPFGDETITDLKHKDISGLRIHNYFFAKSMKALRPGGVMAMVVSKGFMDSTRNQKGRDMMFREARLLGAYRLPNEAFKANANADVTTDIIFLQKRDEPLTGNGPANEPGFRQRAEFKGADGETMQINQYFVDNPDNLLGDMIMNKGRFGPSKEPAMVARDGFDWQSELSSGVDGIEGTYHAERNVQPVSIVGKDDASTDLQRAEVGGLYLNDSGELYRRLPDLEGESRGEPVTGYVNNKGEEKAFSQKDMEKLRAAVGLARTARNLINSQVKELTDTQLQPIRDQLNREYDAFVKKYQMLNRPVNKRLLNNGDLTVAPMLLALENNYRKEKKVQGKKVKESSQKADIFNRRTQEPYSEVTTVSSPEEALIVSLAQTGRVDMDRMAQLLGRSKTEIASQLTDRIYDDPQQGWVTRDEYLSGNVKQKLRQAREAGRGYEDNVKALEAVQPEDVPPEDISVTLGASWQTPDVINGFYTHLGGDKPRSAFIPESNYWSFDAGVSSDKAKQWSTQEMTLKKLFTALLNNKPIAVYRTDPVSEKRILDIRATDAATVKAQEIQNEFTGWLWQDPQRREAMSRRYNDLMNTHKTRQFDGSFLSFPGKISDNIIKLRRTQANAVWRILQSPTTLLDHVVGAGKTFTMIAAAMELKRTGLAKKPLIVVPNHLVPQWAEDFARLYPNARVLAAKKEDFNTHKRKEMLARIATGDWDAVIMAHTSFGKMPNDPEMEKSFIEEQLKDLNRAIEALRKVEDKKSRSVRDAENQKKKLEEKLKKQLENTGKDQGMTWNETGVDALFLDEAHEFKNLQFYTSMNRVKNINPAGSNKAQDLFIKIRAMLQKTGGRNLIFATGTPISNSMAELFTMQRYLAYDQLKDAGLNHFDAWARTFGMVDTKQERKSSGTFGPVSRFSKFVNLPELMTMYRQFGDNINNQDIIDALKEEGRGVHIPKVKGGKPTPVVAPRSIYQEAYMGLIEERFANMPEDPSVDNPLKATNDARKAGLDMRMVFPDLPDDPNSKINQGIDNMMRLYDQWTEDKGTQLIFSDLSTPKNAQAKEISQFRKLVAEAAQDDETGRKGRVNQMTPGELYQYLEAMAEEGNQKAQSRLEKVSPDDIEGWTSTFDVYNDIKQKLISRGIPESEIVFIHSANTDLQKEELFAKVNSGEVRFLLGSTAKMGAGTNVQERLIALHHMDAPWRPSDLEQREGRIIRQGNSLFKRDPDGFEVEILRYATEQTYDVNMWQTLEVKARFIEQVRNGDTTQRQAEDVAGESASAAEMKAASSGDPRIMEQVEIAARLKLLDNLRHTFTRDRTRAVMDEERLKQEKSTLPAVIKSYQKDLDVVLPLQKGTPQLIAPNGKTFKKAKDAEDWLKQSILSKAQDSESSMWHEGQTIGSFRGLEVKAELYSQFAYEGPVDAVKVWLESERDYTIISSPLDDVAWGGLFTRFNNTIKDIEWEIENKRSYLNDIDTGIAEARKRAEAQFKYEEEYQQKNRRNQELIEELGADQEDNQGGIQLPEYRALTNVMEDYGNRPTDTNADWLGNTAIANRAGKLASSIRHSKPGKEQEAANRAMKQATEQNIRITKEDLRRAREQLEAANQSQAEKSTQQAEAKTETVAKPKPVTEFTDASQAVDYMLEKKATVTADNGNIRIERSSPGNWQIKVKEDPETHDFDDDSIVFDATLNRLAGKGSTRIGTEQVISFPENRLNAIVRYLYGKVDLQPEQANTEAVRFRKGERPTLAIRSNNSLAQTGDPVSREELERELEKLKNEYKGLQQDIDFEIVETPEDTPEFADPEGSRILGRYVPAVAGREEKTPKIIFYRSNIRRLRDFTRTLRHETFVHMALDREDPIRRQAIIKDLVNSLYKDPDLKKKLFGTRPEKGILLRYDDEDIDIQAEEVLASLAETDITHPRYKIITHKINQFARKLGVDVRYSRREAQGLIASLETRLKSGELSGKGRRILLNAEPYKQEIEQAIHQLTGDIQQHVELVESVRDLPEHLHSIIMTNPETKAVYDDSDGSVYLMVDNQLNTTDAVQSVLHEVVGHKGIRAVLGDRLDSELINIYQGLAQEERNTIGSKYYRELEGKDPADIARYIADEYLSHLAETNPTHNLVRRAVAVVRNWLREKSPNLIKQWTHDDMVALLAQSRKAMAAAPGPEQNQQNILAGKTDNIRFRKSDDSASFTVKKGKNQPSRLFNTEALAESQVIKAATRTRSSLMVPIRKLMLPSMGLRQIVDTYERIFAPLAGEMWDVVGGVSKGNPITHYQDFVQNMQSLKANKLNEADDIDIDWGKLAKKNKKDYETLADIFHRSTLFEVFPDRAEFNAHEDPRKLTMEIAQSKDPKHQADLRKRLMYERERKAEHRKLHERYQALGDPAKKVYKGVEKYYEDMWQDQQKALEEKILRSMHDTESRQFFLTNLRKKFHEAKVNGPYFPLQRFGSFFVIAEDENGEYYRAHFETEAKLQKEKESLKREGMRILSYGLTPDFTSRKLEGVSQFADEIHLSLDSDKFANVGQKVKDEIRNEINQLALQLMPDVSAAKHMIRRKKVKGFNENARRAFAYNAIHSSNRLARTKYGDQMATQLERIREDIDAQNHEPYIPMKDRTVAAQVLSELEQQHEHIMNPKGSPIAARITNLAFIWYLGASAGAGLVNLTQTPLIGIPLMGGRFGYRKTSVAMMKAAKDFSVHGYNKVSLRESVFTLSKANKGVSADEKKMLEQLIDDGTIDTTQTSTLAQISDTDLKAEAQTQQDAWVKVNRLLGFFFHNAETANREVTALATYRLAREEGQTHQVAIEQSRKMVFDSHFDYSGANRPRVMKNDWMKVFTIFKQYSQNMTYTLMRNFVDSLPFRELSARDKKAARKALAGMLFAHGTAAGTLGLPLISWIGPVLAEAFGDDDDEFRDWETMYRNWLADMVGKEAGHAIAKGVVNGFTGADLHSRVSINDLWVRSPNWEMSAREENMHYLTQALGPAFGAGLNFTVGLDQVANGDWKGIEKMVPKFIRDGIRSYRYSTEGATVGREGYQAVVEEFKPWELGLQAFGLAPARLGEAYEARSAVKNIQSRLQQRRQELTTDYARAIREGDYQTANESLIAITDFNIANPSFRITPQGLKNSLKMRYRYENLSEQGIYLPQAQLGLLKEARFAL